MDHAAEKELIDRSDVLQAIKDPDSVGKGDRLLYYISEVKNTGEYVIIKVWAGNGVPQDVIDKFGQQIDNWLGTSLVDEKIGQSDELYDNIKDVKDAAENSAEDSHDDDIKDWNDNPGGY